MLQCWVIYILGNTSRLNSFHHLRTSLALIGTDKSGEAGKLINIPIALICTVNQISLTRHFNNCFHAITLKCPDRLTDRTISTASSSWPTFTVSSWAS